MERLATERLRLRPYRESDRGTFVQLFSDPEVMAYAGGAICVGTADRLFDSLLSGAHPRAVATWAVEELVTEVHVGHGALLRASAGESIEIGFLLRFDCWGRGLGTEIARALLKEGAARASRVIATVDLGHAACRRVLEKAGMALVATENDGDGEYLVYRAGG